MSHTNITVFHMLNILMNQFRSVFDKVQLLIVYFSKISIQKD